MVFYHNTSALYVKNLVAVADVSGDNGSIGFGQNNAGARKSHPCAAGGCGREKSAPRLLKKNRLAGSCG